MKNVTSLSLVMLLIGSHAFAQDDPFADPSGFSLLLGYKSVPVKQSFAHDTNPGDSFLPNAGVQGSAGTTSLDRAQYIDAGLRYETPYFSESKWNLNLDVAGLFAYTSGNGATSSGMNLDDRQNANDSRPPANAAFIYTDSNWGFDTALGINYHLMRHVYMGLVGDFTGVYIENGWDRYSSYTPQQSKWVLIAAGGPKIGCRFSERFGVEGTVLVGKNGVGFNTGLVFHF